MNRKNDITGLAVTLGALLVSLLPSTPVQAGESGLDGLWASHRILGPPESGPLLIRGTGDRTVAEVGGQRIETAVTDGFVQFTTPDGARFRGRMTEAGDIRGHWLQPPSRFDGNVFATPVRLHRHTDGWYGEISPQPDAATFHLILKDDGTEVGAELINPERNLGVFAGLSRAVRDANAIALMGRFRGKGPEQVMLRGAWHPDEGVLALRYPGRGGGYDFRRVDPGQATGFLARTSTSDLIVTPPPSLDDGWATASPEDVGIDIAPIEEMIRNEILPAPTSTHDLAIHALLIARHGKLAVEEYFHGFHRDLRHDSRSASKSVTTLLAAAAMHSGTELEWDTKVYPLFDEPQLPEREPARGEIRLRHLLNMNSGLDCDDRNPQSAANEDYLWDHADELDFYEHTLGVDVVHAPGEVAAYCSAGSNLAGGVIAAAAGEDLLELLDRLVAEPLDIDRYSVPVPPDGHPYTGGGIRWLARDFLKFPQLMLQDGQWRGRRVLSRSDVRRILTPVVRIDGGRDYGYLWWTGDYPYRGRTVRAHFMSGNGGQLAMLVPELDVSIVFNAGNYSDRVMFRIQEELVPEYILPALSE